MPLAYIFGIGGPMLGWAVILAVLGRAARGTRRLHR
jgi:hypothetical protein